MNKSYLRENSLPIHLTIITIINILLLFVPLTNVFGYEFAAINALFLFFQSGVFTISNLKKLSTGKSLSEILIKTSVGLLILAAIPIIISCLNSLFTSGCSYIDGLLFYIIITLPSLLAGTSIGTLIYSVLPKFRRPAFLLIYFSLFLIPLFEFYLNPQVYFFTPLLGYFPGVIYDEGLSVNYQMFLYRIFNTFFFGSILLFSIVAIKKSFRYKIVLVVLTFLVSGLFYSFSPYFGFSTTKGRLISHLDKKIETEHFIIHFSNKIDDNFISLITLQHEYYFSELTEYFKSSPVDKITSYVFYDRTEKKVLLGSENADIAKPWLNQVFTSYENYNTTLKHELAHVFTADFGKGLLHVADDFNPSLIEGAAMASDPLYGENNLDYMAALAFNNGYKTNMKRLYDHFNFFKQNSSLSYIYAGSFSKYLVDKYGIEKFKRLYSNLNFEEVYRIDFEKIVSGYYGYLKTIKHSYNKHAANYYFGKKSIFFKICPRHVTDQIKKAWVLYNDKSYCESRDIFKNSYDLSDDYSALYGYINSLSKLKERTAAIVFLEKEMNKFKGTSSYYNLEIRLADLYAEDGEISKADSLYIEIIHQNPGRTFYYLAHTRLFLSKEYSNLKIYLNGSDFTKYYILKKLFSRRNNYNLLPIMINLSRELDEDYILFISQFANNLSEESYESSYALYKLSNYMLENLDFKNARKIASLAIRFKEDENFLTILKKNQDKIIWLQNNYEILLAGIQNQM